MSRTTKLVRFGAAAMSALYLSAWIATGDSVFSTFPLGVAFGLAAVRFDDWTDAAERWYLSRQESDDAKEPDNTPTIPDDLVVRGSWPWPADRSRTTCDRCGRRKFGRTLAEQCMCV